MNKGAKENKKGKKGIGLQKLSGKGQKREKEKARKMRGRKIERGGMDLSFRGKVRKIKNCRNGKRWGKR